MKPSSSQNIKYVLMHSSTVLLSEILSKWKIYIGPTEKFSLSQEEQNRHSLLVQLSN